MSFPKDDNELSAALSDAFTPPPSADFDSWRRQHPEAVACLNPQRIAGLTRRRMLLSRTFVFATTAAVLAGVWVAVSQFPVDGVDAGAFGQTVSQIERAKTITWKTIGYVHSTGKNGKNTWLHLDVVDCAFRVPGLERQAWLDEKGQVKLLVITDAIHGRTLTCSPKEKQARLTQFLPVSHDLGPLAYY
jgi:hypothetical protein